MAHHTAVCCHKKRFQCLVFLDQFLRIGTLFCYIDCHSHSPHNAAVQIVQRGFICSKHFFPFTGLDDLIGNKSLLLFHDFIFRCNTGGIILLHIPDICMSAPLHLLLGFIHCLTKTIVHFLMDPVFVLIPDKIRHTVDRAVQILRCLPVILFHFIGLLPSPETEPYLLLRQRQCPDIRNFRQAVSQLLKLSLLRQKYQFCLRLLPCSQLLHFLYCIHIMQICKDHISLFCQLLFWAFAFYVFMRKRLQRGHSADNIKKMTFLTNHITIYMTMIHRHPPIIHYQKRHFYPAINFMVSQQI